jgi:hypothetical protein
MGAWLTSILQGVGRTGNELAEAKYNNAQDKQKQIEQQQKMQQFKMQMQELQQRLATGKAPQVADTYTDANGKRIDTVRDPMTGALTERAGGQAAAKAEYQPYVDDKGSVLSFNKGTGEFKTPTVNGQPITAAGKGKNGILMVDGAPIGVYRNGQTLTPGDPEFSAQDAKHLMEAKGGYEKGEQNKDKRIQLAASSRIAAYLQSRMYGVMDAETGSLVMVPAADISKNPGKYAPAGPATTLKNRIAIFNEIDYTSGMLKESISALPNSAFDPGARAQIAMVLRDEAPKAALYNFLNSDVAATLSPDQINYVTSLVSMDETAMSLRSIGGQGQGSDTLRAAVLKMLPGAGTPSKAYAERQMVLFDGTVKALRTSISGIGEPGHGGGTTKGDTKTGTPPPGAKIVKWDDVK